ncbi:mitochondrial 54S ribosomal protein uL15m [Lipomyces oligophaga]|uniref:mitochondrial 54S ribosomal protein uL15m n=1 Tax=Lipomyces oligophaga TaxID=45792 RepID=UPI0034CFA7C1
MLRISTVRTVVFTAVRHPRVVLLGANNLQKAVQSKRHGSIIANLRNVPSSYSKKKRVGRGPSSGKGKTSGRGSKGQKQKESVQPWFEGGQTPISKLFPKIGFRSRIKKDYVQLNLERVQEWIDAGRLDSSEPITMKHLLDSRLCRGIKDGVKLLGNGSEKLTVPINITVSAASRNAVARVRELGGTVTSKYYNKLTLRAHLHPERFERVPLDADPVKKRNVFYYKNPDVGGYLTPPEAVPSTGENGWPDRRVFFVKRKKYLPPATIDLIRKKKLSKTASKSKLKAKRA